MQKCEAISSQSGKTTVTRFAFGRVFGDFGTASERSAAGARSVGRTSALEKRFDRLFEIETLASNAPIDPSAGFFKKFGWLNHIFG